MRHIRQEGRFQTVKFAQLGHRRGLFRVEPGILQSDAYLRGADLRGCDLSQADLEGASIHGAKIGGTLFPKSLSAQEIRLSDELGTRMRTSH